MKTFSRRGDMVDLRNLTVSGPGRVKRTIGNSGDKSSAYTETKTTQYLVNFQATFI